MNSDDTNSNDMKTVDHSAPELQPLKSRSRRIIAVTALVCGLGIAAGGVVAATSGVPEHFGWRAGDRLEHAQHFVLKALDSVGATTAQETKVHDIIATTFTDLTKDGDPREALRKQVIELLKAPTIDTAAIEKLRAEQISKLDATSKKLVGSLVDAANQLTPEQRAKLADRAEAMAQRGPGWGHGGPHDGPEGGRDGGRMHEHHGEREDFDRPDFEHGHDGQRPDHG